MQKPFALLKRIAEHPISTGCSGLAGAVALLTPVASQAGLLEMPEAFSPVITAGVGLAFSAVFGYGMMAGTRRSLKLQRVGEKLHEINHLYRDRVGAFLDQEGGEEHLEDDEPDDLEYGAQLAREERETLHMVCQKVGDIFEVLTERQCMVSIRLISNDATKLVLYTRSQKGTNRDQQGKRYTVKSFKTGQNLGFDKAAERKDGYPSYYISNDLVADERKERFADERRIYPTFYKSVLIVPIRMCGDDSQNLLGFLYVDSTARNCFSRSRDLHLLCALADQIYNYISLMRIGFMPEEALARIDEILEKEEL